MRKTRGNFSKQTFSESRTTDFASNKFLSLDMNVVNQNPGSNGGNPNPVDKRMHTTSGGRRQKQYYAQFN